MKTAGDVIKEMAEKAVAGLPEAVSVLCDVAPNLRQGQVWRLVGRDVMPAYKAEGVEWMIWPAEVRRLMVAGVMAPASDLVAAGAAA